MKTSQVVKDDIIELMNIMYKVINRKKKNTKKNNKIYTCECFRHDKNSIIEIGNQRIM